MGIIDGKETNYLIRQIQMDRLEANPKVDKWSGSGGKVRGESPSSLCLSDYCRFMDQLSKQFAYGERVFFLILERMGSDITDKDKGFYSKF